MWFLHRLILITFIGESKLECNHKNGIKNDNRLENLEWLSRSDNERHAYRNNLKSKKGIKHHLNKLNEEEVRNIKYKETGMLKNIAIKYSVTGQQIANIKNGKSWSHIK